jgi:hypothetical protein
MKNSLQKYQPEQDKVSLRINEKHLRRYQHRPTPHRWHLLAVSVNPPQEHCFHQQRTLHEERDQGLTTTVAIAE